MPTLKLSEHFSLDEATDSDTAVRLGIVNTPNEKQISALRISAAGMELVRDLLKYPITPNSWFRCEALEKVLAKKDYIGWCALHQKPVIPSSWDEYFFRKAHPKGYAVDFTCSAFGNPAAIVEAIRRSEIKFDKLIREGTWVHISFAPAMRRSVMEATFVDGIPSYKEV